MPEENQVPENEGQTTSTLEAEIETLKEELEKIKGQRDEKQKVIDEHRTEFSLLKEEIKTLKENTEPETKPAEKPAVDTAKTAEQIADENNKRISTLTVPEREALDKQYGDMTDEQKAFLASPEGMSTFLDNLTVAAPEVATSPFALKPKAKSPKEQFEALFINKQTPPVAQKKGTGFQPEAVKSKPVAAYNKKVADEQQQFGIY